MEKISTNTLETQKTLLPQSQPAAKNILNYRDYEQYRDKRNKDIRELRNAIRLIELDIDDYYSKKCGKKQVAVNEYTFIKKCSHGDCNGMLEKNWKCPLCEKYTCSKCHMPKKEDHVCDEDNLKNIEALKKDTKPCPKCGMGIFKIDGCDQMWCLKCNTAFSWRTGKIENGYIHNPEYFRFRRENNLAIARNPNENRGFEINECFDPLETENRQAVWRHLERVIVNLRRREDNDGKIGRIVTELFRSATHHKIITLDVYNLDLNDLYHELRVKYLVKDIDIKTWKTEISRKTKEYERKHSQYNIINTLLKIWGDIIMNLMFIIEAGEDDYLAKAEDQVRILGKAIDNTNTELSTARKLFKSKESKYFRLTREPNNRYAATIVIDYI